MIKKNQIHNTCALWLSVLRTKGVGPISFWQLFDKDPLFQNAVKQNVMNEIEMHQTHNFSLICADESIFPERLKHLKDCPPVISYGGSMSYLNAPIIAIVGARNASAGGLKIAHSIAKNLTKAGYSIISGVARGIDGAAHAGSLEGKHSINHTDGNHASTIGILAGGINNIYPPEHKELYKHILEHGCLISEMPFGTVPAAPLFPRRNRLIAALCKGIVLIEAAEKSGTLITAEYALNLGRDVFVVPGSPLDPRSLGGNRLLKQGAIIVETAQDIIDYYGVENSQMHQEHKQNKKSRAQTHFSTRGKSSKDEDTALSITTEPFSTTADASSSTDWVSYLSMSPISFEDAFAFAKQNDSSLTTQSFMVQLMQLEFDGLIVKTSAGMISRQYK